jgi:hypothetical protein
MGWAASAGWYVCPHWWLRRDAIITNPPPSLSNVRLSLMASDGLVAMLLRTDFDHAKSRQHLYVGNVSDTTRR